MGFVVLLLPKWLVYMEEKITSLEQNVITVSKELVALKELIATVLTKVDTNFGVVEKKLSTLEKKINELNFKIDNLDVNTVSGFNEVGNKIESLTEEITKIGTVTGYDEMYKNQKGLN